MLGFKSLRSARVTLAGIALWRKLKKEHGDVFAFLGAILCACHRKISAPDDPY